MSIIEKHQMTMQALGHTLQLYYVASNRIKFAHFNLSTQTVDKINVHRGLFGALPSTIIIETLGY